MKRLCLVLAVLFCCAALVFPVSAQSGAEQIRSETTITADGNCIVSLTAAIHLDETVTDPVFPIPDQAADVTLNGSPLGLVGNQVSLKSVTGGMAGDFSFVLTYTMSGVVATDEEGQMMLTLPILSGFAYPVQALEFSVKLPGEISTQPTFTSAYYQENIQSVLNITAAGSTITGVAAEALKDHETLVMTLPVTEELFPQTAATARVLGLMDIAVIVAVLLAIGYYFLALRPTVPKRVLRATAPDGISAGDLAMWFTGSGMDLSLMVVTWAQLGYLRIQVDDSGRVLLHKRMDMGNERSVFENRCYKNLFGRRQIVDGTGYHYAELCRTVAKKSPGAKEVYLPSSGNPKIFRALCALATALSGIALAGAFNSQSWVLRIAMIVLTILFSVAIQSGGACVPLRGKLPLYMALGCGVVWILLGFWAGAPVMPIVMVVFQFLAGIATAYSGRRTELGQQALGQILGLRKHMRTVSKQELQRLLKVNPGYFHELAPYALAMDTDRAFARRFARLRLPECTYLVGPMRGQLTAAEWAALLRNTVNTLDAKAKRLPLDKLMGR